MSESKTTVEEKDAEEKFEAESFKWITSAARYIMLLDLEDGVLLLKDKEMSAEEAWKVYSQMIEFKNVEFQKFKEKLKDHRDQVQIKLNRSINETRAFERDLKIYPPRKNNRNGGIFWDNSKAKGKLQEDIANGLNEQFKPSQLHKSCPEYKMFKLDDFCQHIYQEVRRTKMLNMLETKREAIKTAKLTEKKRKKRRENRKKRKRKQKLWLTRQKKQHVNLVLLAVAPTIKGKALRGVHIAR